MKPRTAHRSVSAARRRLGLVLLLFFIALALPLSLLVSHLYQQLDQQQRYQYRSQAEQLVEQINQQIAGRLEIEEQRPFADYSFFNVLENPLLPAKGITFSPLSQLPPASDIPGIIGYFQIDPDDAFHSPVLPDQDNQHLSAELPGFSQDELSNRRALRQRLRSLLLAESEQAVVKPAQAALMKETTVAAAAVGEEEKHQSVASVGSRRPEPGDNKNNIRESFAKLFRSSRSYDSPGKYEAESLQAGRAIAEQVAKSDHDSLRSDRIESIEDDQKTSKSDIAQPSRANRKSREKRAKKAITTAQLDHYNIDSRQWKREAKKVQTITRVKKKAIRKEKGKLPDQAAAGALFKQSKQSSPQFESAPAAPQLSGKVAPLASLADAGIKELKDRAVEGDALSDEMNERIGAVSIHHFDSEVERLQMISLGGGYDCFFRRVWHDDGRYIQGFIVDRATFLKRMVELPFYASRIAEGSRLLIAYNDQVIEQIGQLNGAIGGASAPASSNQALLYRHWLATPLSNVELLFSAASTPIDANRWLIDLTAVTLGMVLLGGLIGLYRLGLHQIELTRQQSNFISAVSHELKTPLTSIRMYSEMLRSNWVDDEQKRAGYYDYIFFESERLSRLIANVLQLARLENSAAKLSIHSYSPDQLFATVHDTIINQVEAAAFQLTMIEEHGASEAAQIDADSDAFAQIMINLVDNALKFSAQCEPKRLEIGWRVNQSDNTVTFSVRDYGPGIERRQAKKIFQLFYRSGDELTRTKPGTGIGLALVRQLADRMGATVDLINRKPGSEFRLRFAMADKQKSLSAHHLPW